MINSRINDHKEIGPILKYQKSICEYCILKFYFQNFGTFLNWQHRTKFHINVLNMDYFKLITLKFKTLTHSNDNHIRILCMEEHCLLSQVKEIIL